MASNRGRKQKNALLIALVAVALAVLSLVFGLDLTAPDDQPVSAQDCILQAVMLDVGQGDSIVLISSGQYILIDAGENDRGDEVVAALRRLGATKLAAVVGTHPHSDHIGGLDTVIGAFPVGAVYMPEITNNTETYEDVLDAVEAAGLHVTAPKPGESIKLGKAVLTFLWPPQGYASDNVNNHSIVVRVEAAGHSLLLCGDIEADAEQGLLDAGADIDCDVLKVAHHGSDTSTTERFLEAAQPVYALISVGRGNDYGHPEGKILGRLTDAGATVLRTDKNGTVTVTVSDDGLAVKSAR